jgi:hypothetical protein
MSSLTIGPKIDGEPGPMVSVAWKIDIFVFNQSSNFVLNLITELTDVAQYERARLTAPGRKRVRRA